MTNTMRCDRTPAWAALNKQFESSGKHFDLRQAFAQDGERFERFSQDAPHIFADLSKNLIDSTTQDLLFELALQTDVQGQRDAMFAGEAINSTEQRQVLHWLLRSPADALKRGLVGRQLANEQAQVQQTLDAMLDFAQSVRGNRAITDVVSIGIGGSDLGGLMAVLALNAFVTPDQRFHFVSNLDGHELAAKLKRLQPESTLFLIASKSFTTSETLRNALSAKQWFQANGGTDVARHFVALTTHVTAARAFGISTTFGFWDWVGGRYSLCSAIGLPLAIAIGAEGFRSFLAGAHAMDQHFRTAPLASNLPIRLGLLDVWNRNFHGFGSRNIAPYHSALRRLAAYLQQLEMESNGKRVGRDGQLLPFATAPVLWGEPGTNGQHAYFQHLHQGSDVIPVEFVAVKTAEHDLPEHQQGLLANALAQAQALMLGQDDPDTGGEGHRHFEGNRPSTFLLLERLDPVSLGAFIALQEHRVFVSGAVWGINSFDQWGVELGKQLAKDIAPRLVSGDLAGLDASTAGLLKKLRA
ncbi:MAG: glucose-6-phosphate isomerase [Burkholderiaceae bacterium]